MCYGMIQDGKEDQMYRIRRQHPFSTLSNTISPSSWTQLTTRYRTVRLLRSKPFRLLLIILLGMLLELTVHNRSLQPVTPPKSIDAPFFPSGCVEPDPSAPRENAVIMMLATNADALSAVKTLRNFETRFNRHYHYPYVFFNNEPWGQKFMNRVKRVVTSNVSFEVLGTDLWGFPEWMDERDRERARGKMVDSDVMYAEREDYHHMCRFFAGKFYDHPALKSYKWYWRLDSDVEFLCSMPYDPFVAMKNNHKKYGYTMALWDVGSTVPSLFKVLERYRREHLIPRSNMYLAFMEGSWAPWPLRRLLNGLNGRNDDGDAWNFCHFWSNFEIADLDWFRGKEYRDLYDYLERNGGMYFERWGDAPIHSLAAALLLDPSEIHYFRDYGYLHDQLQRCPANKAGGQLPMSIELGSHSYDAEDKDGVGCRCECRDDAESLMPTCQNAINRAVGDRGGVSTLGSLMWLGKCGIREGGVGMW